MKRVILFTIATILFQFNSPAQIIDGVEIPKDVTICSVRGVEKGLSNTKYNFRCDYGQKQSDWYGTMSLTDKDGKKFKPVYKQEVMQYFIDHNWELIGTSNSKNEMNSDVVEFTFKRKET